MKTPARRVHGSPSLSFSPTTASRHLNACKYDCSAPEPSPRSSSMSPRSIQPSQNRGLRVTDRSTEASASSSLPSMTAILERAFHASSYDGLRSSDSSIRS